MFGGLLGGFSFSQYALVVSRYDALYIIHASIANLDRFSVEDFMEGIPSIYFTKYARKFYAARFKVISNEHLSANTLRVI